MLAWTSQVLTSWSPSCETLGVDTAAELHELLLALVWEP